MDYITIVYEGAEYYLIKQPNDTWYFTDLLPPINGESPILIDITFNDDTSITINTDDTFLQDVIVGFIQSGRSYFGQRMFNYYPRVIQVLLEYEGLIKAVGFEIDFLRGHFTFTYNDTFLMTMGEDRTVQWEKALGITPAENSTLDERRRVIMARIQGGFKLNTESIANIVKTLTNGTCVSYVEDSCLYVEVKPPEGDRTISFPTVEEELKRRIPAHLGLNINRWFARWQEINDNFGSWQDVYNNFGSWQDVRFYSGVVSNTEGG